MNKEKLKEIFEKRNTKLQNELNYYIKNKNRIKNLIELIDNEDDKTFFITLLYVYERTTNEKLIKSIVKFVGYYYYLFIRQKTLNKKMINDYKNNYELLIKLLNEKLENIKIFNNLINKSKNNIIRHILNTDIKINEIKKRGNDKVNDKIKKFEKIEKTGVKKLENIDRLQNKLKELLER